MILTLLLTKNNEEKTVSITVPSSLTLKQYEDIVDNYTNEGYTVSLLKFKEV